MTELLMQLKAFLLWALLLVPPFVLTALNLWNLFAECSGRRKLAPRVFAGLSMGIGAAEYFLLLCVEFEYSGKDYDQATYTFQTHNLIDSSHALSFWLPVLVGIVGWCFCSGADRNSCRRWFLPVQWQGCWWEISCRYFWQCRLPNRQIFTGFWIGISTFITAICCCCLRWESAGISPDRQGFCGNDR